MNKFKVSLSVLVTLFITAGVVWAANGVLKTINGDSTQDQIFQAGSNIKISLSNGSGLHTISFDGILGLASGGTGASSFTAGSIPFSNGTSLSQDNSNFFWDSTGKLLGITGTVSATQVVTDSVNSSGSNQTLALNPAGAGVVLSNLPSDPLNGRLGQMYFNTSLGKFRGFNGTTWVTLLDNFLVPTPSPTPSLNVGLISFWKLDELNGDATDSVGSNDMVNVNAISYLSGRVGGAADLEKGSSQYFNIDDNSQIDLDLTGTDFSFSFWIKPESHTTTGFLINKWSDDTNQNAYFVSLMPDGDIEVRFHNSTIAPAYDFPANITDGNWYHVVLTYDSVTGNAEVYVNNSSLGTAPFFIGGMVDTSAPFQIGSVISGGQVFFYDGLLDEVGIWNRVLTSSEVAELYNNGGGIALP